MIAVQKSSKSFMLLEKLHLYFYCVTFAFAFIGLFNMPKGHEVMEVLVIVSLSLGILNKLINKQVFLPVPKLWVTILLIAGGVLLANDYLHGDRDRLGRAFLYMAFFVSFRPKIPCIKQLVFYSAVIGGVGLGVLSLYQFLNGLHRVEGFTNAIPFSQAVLVILIFNLYFFIRQKDNSRYLSCLSIGFLFIALYLSQTRGVWLALLLLVFIYLLIKIYKKPLKYLLIALGVIVAVFSTYEISSIVKEKVNTGISDLQRAQKGEFGSSWGMRLVAWDSAVKAIKDKPLLGIGRDNFFSYRKEQVARGEVDPIILRFVLPHAHNQYLQSQLIRGVPGTAVLLLLLLYPWFVTGCFNQRALLFKSISFVYAIFGLSDVPFEHLNSLYLYVLSMTLLSYYLLEEKENKKEESR